MKGTHLGELEELILLIVASLDDQAYGVAVQNEIIARCNRTIGIGTVHNVLQRLYEKGFLESHYGGNTNQRGGRRKHLFKVTKTGLQTIQYVRQQRESLWKTIPSLQSSN